MSLPTTAGPLHSSAAIWGFGLSTQPLSKCSFFFPPVCHLCSFRESHTFQNHVNLRGCMWFFFFFFPSCFPLQSYFESVLPLFPPPGLFRLVLAHLRAEHLHLDLMSRGCGTAGTCRLHGHPWVRTSCSIPGARYPLRQSPTAVLAIGVSPKKGSQSQEELAGC